MKPQLTLTLSLATIAVLLLMTLLPSESSTAGWILYGVMIGMLLSTAIRAANDLMRQPKIVQVKRDYYSCSR